MFNFKAVYFYLLAVKITLTQFLKKIYFLTSYYNKSLKTKLPLQLYFYPNPFLLSSFVNQKNFSFKLSKVNVDTFWSEHANNKEEEDIIIPIVKSMKEKGFNIHGPFSADTIFTREDSDIVLAMYHDQALPVIKTLQFGNIVNTTLGLPIVRTSVDHGTALDIAGTNEADAGSLISAINTAIEIVKQKNATQH
jgi:hypothetical protein